MIKIKGKNIKRGTVLVVASVIVLTLVTMNVTYSAFFSVQTADNVQVINAGNLNVTASAVETTKQPDGLMPSDEYSSINAPDTVISGSNYVMSTLTVSNSDGVNARIGVSIKNSASNDTVNLSNVVIAIQKDKKWITFGDGSTYYTPISGLSPEEGNSGSYPIINDSINKGTTSIYTIYMWLNPETGDDQVDKALNYSVVVKAIPAEGQGTDNTVPSVSKTKAS